VWDLTMRREPRWQMGALDKARARGTTTAQRSIRPLKIELTIACLRLTMLEALRFRFPSFSIGRDAANAL